MIYIPRPLDRVPRLWARRMSAFSAVAGPLNAVDAVALAGNTVAVVAAKTWITVIKQNQKLHKRLRKTNLA